jgi:hypothetical protein
LKNCKLLHVFAYWLLAPGCWVQRAEERLSWLSWLSWLLSEFRHDSYRVQSLKYFLICYFVISYFDFLPFTKCRWLLASGSFVGWLSPLGGRGSVGVAYVSLVTCLLSLVSCYLSLVSWYFPDSYRGLILAAAYWGTEGLSSDPIAIGFRGRRSEFKTYIFLIHAPDSYRVMHSCICCWLLVTGSEVRVTGCNWSGFAVYRFI